MIKSLAELGINVLMPDFKTFEEDKHFGQIVSEYESAALNTSLININRVRFHSTHPLGPDASLFGQRLTDFGNGYVLKRLAKSVIPDLDGYRFTEYQDVRGSTYCLLDSSKLSKVDKQIISLNK